MSQSKGWGIKPITTTRIPANHLALVAETRTARTAGGHEETFRLAAFQGGQRSEAGVTWYAQCFEHSPGAMWDLFHLKTPHEGVTFLWVHDLQRVVRIVQLLQRLPEAGWQLDALSLNPGAPWMVFRRKRATLKVVDLMSIWPTTLERIGQYFGLAQRERPDEDAPVLSWVAYARRNLEIVTGAVSAYVHWIERNDLGSLSVTGNGQAWQAFRRRFMPYGILVHHDEDLLAMERRAMWTGRCEAYWRGALPMEEVDEWDFSSAHNNIALTHDMPTFPHGPIATIGKAREAVADNKYHVLAEVEVHVDKPVVPTLRGGHIVWPTGAFRTTLWSPELRLLFDAGHDVRLLRGWAYRRAPALQHWAAWVRAHLDADDDVVPAWAKDLVKRWGNTLVGRFAMRYPKWRKLGRASVADVFCTPCVSLQSEEEYLLMQVGYDVWQQEGLAAPRNSAPMITGYVMSAMRAQLWRCMTALPAQALLYVDTDSLLVLDQWRSAMERLAKTEEGQGLRLKRSWKGMQIYGPRQLVTGDSVRISGLPKVARRVDRERWEGETVESLQAAMAARSATMVRLADREWRVEGVDTRRMGAGFGWTQPFHLPG